MRIPDKAVPNVVGVDNYIILSNEKLLYQIGYAFCYIELHSHKNTSLILLV